MIFTPSRPTRVEPHLYDRIAVTIYLGKDDIDTAEELAHIFPGKTYKLTEIAENKTLSQIGYAWSIMRDMAEIPKFRSQGMKADDIYLEYVRRFYMYEIIKLPLEAADKYMKLWDLQGKGWQSEIISEVDGEVEIMCYYGMKKWNKKQLSNFIDQLKDDCRELKIPIEREIR